ncbi:MAG: radical SAM family heme chaperone HemW [Verrucomicrobiota bacterium]
MRIRSPEPVTSLYAHVPFCAHKCEYCAFYSHTPAPDLVNRYVAALTRELEQVSSDLQPLTVFFGGGTPSLLNLRQWEKILDAMQRLDLLGAFEWTVECNPATVSLDKARLLRRYGVNRISMGVQSFDEGLLDRIGRIHSREMVFKSYDILRLAGFDNINIDLMFAIPGQTMEIWSETLREALALQTEHLSCYEVIYEEDTPLFAQLKAGRFSVDEDLACDMYEKLVEEAGAHDFVQYEVANFAKCRAQTSSKVANDHRALETDSEIPGWACMHNINYWRGGSYYGIGPSAAGYLRGLRTKNWSNTALYCEQIEKGQRAIEWQEQLSPLDRAGETAAFGLRMNAGWPLQLFRKITGFDLREYWAEPIALLIERGFAHLDDTRFRLTPRGLRFADWAAEQFIQPMALAPDRPPRLEPAVK